MYARHVYLYMFVFIACVKMCAQAYIYICLYEQHVYRHMCTQHVYLD